MPLDTVLEAIDTAFLPLPLELEVTTEKPGPTLHLTTPFGDAKLVPKETVPSVLNWQSLEAGTGAAAAEVRRSMKVPATAEIDFMLTKDNREVAVAYRGVALVLKKDAAQFAEDSLPTRAPCTHTQLPTQMVDVYVGSLVSSAEAFRGVFLQFSQKCTSFPLFI